MTDPAIIEAAAAKVTYGRVFREGDCPHCQGTGQQLRFEADETYVANPALRALYRRGAEIQQNGIDTPLIEAAALERAAKLVDDRAASSASNAEFARDNGDREELILRFALKVADYKRLASDIRALIPKDSGGGR